MKHRYAGHHHKPPKIVHHQKDDLRSMRAERAKTARMLRQCIAVVGLLLSTALLVGIYRTLTWSPNPTATAQVAAVHPRTRVCVVGAQGQRWCATFLAVSCRFPPRPSVAGH